MQRPLYGIQKRGEMKKILGRIACQAEFWTENQINARFTRQLKRLFDLARIALQIADGRIDLRNEKAHLTSKIV